jgi:hypothetical protein
VVGLLADEDTQRPIFVPFLGTLAATTPSAAFLQRVTGAPIVVASVNRVGRGRWRCHVWRVIRFQPAADVASGERAVTASVSEALSQAIRAYPEQWFWGSRRFFTIPPGERPGPDGLPPRAVRRPPCASATLNVWGLPWPISREGRAHGRDRPGCRRSGLDWMAFQEVWTEGARRV